MSTTTPKPTLLTLKLLTDANNNRVLFAEAGKDFVDFLFSLMSLPVATVIGLLSADEMVGTLGKVYQSVESLSDTYVQTDADKAALLKPTVFDGSGAAKVFVTLRDGGAKPFNMCGGCRRFVAYRANVLCPSCKTRISTAWNLSLVDHSNASQEGGGGGYVKEAVTYMVMDDLQVKPMSTMSTIQMFKKFGINDVRDVKEFVVSIGMDEGLKLLKASFESKTVLSDVFLAAVGSIKDSPI